MRKHDWSKIHEKFLIRETNKPMLIKFPTYEDLAAWHKLHDYENAGNDFFAQHGL